MTEEAQRRGLECASELDKETCDAIYDQAEAEMQAQGIDTDPAGVNRPRPPRRGTWIIPQVTMALAIARLIDMVNPDGEEGHELRPRERLMAAQLLIQLDRLAMDQDAFAQEVWAAGPVFDLDRALDEIEAAIPRRLEERRRERAEGLRRLAEAEAAAKAARSSEVSS